MLGVSASSPVVAESRDAARPDGQYHLVDIWNPQRAGCAGNERGRLRSTGAHKLYESASENRRGTILMTSDALRRCRSRVEESRPLVLVSPGGWNYTRTNRSGVGNGKGRRNVVFAIVNTALTATTIIVTVSIRAMARPGRFASVRNAMFIGCRQIRKTIYGAAARRRMSVAMLLPLRTRTTVRRCP
jgi:hypothetical protein